MHYYQFNIGDYTKRTARLSPLEDIAYRRLLDQYYLNERPFNESEQTLARDIGMSEYLPEVTYILDRYFPLENGERINKRAQEEIRLFHMKKKTASKAGKASGKARRSKASERVLNDRSLSVEQKRDSVEPTNNHKPRTKNQEPLTSNQKPVTKNQKPNGKSKPIVTLTRDDNLLKMITDRNINPDSWNDFEQHRKEIKKPLTDLARKKAMDQIKHLDWQDQAKTIDKSIQSRWAGLFPEKSKVVTIQQSQSRAQQQAERIKQQMGWTDE